MFFLGHNDLGQVAPPDRDCTAVVFVFMPRSDLTQIVLTQNMTRFSSKSFGPTYKTSRSQIG